VGVANLAPGRPGNREGDRGTVAPGLSDPALEVHYTVAELGKLWGLDAKTVRRMFAHEPGVLKFGRPETRHKRGYISLRIPASVAVRLHRRHSAG
jgi:hypothetical protein